VPKRNRRILLADDDEIVQEAVQYAAEEHGHHMIRAFTARAALESALITQPDMIVLDIGLPDGDGRDVLAKLKASPRTARIPVLVWSARENSDSDSRIALELGAEDYLEKSYAELLIGKVERILLRLGK